MARRRDSKGRFLPKVRSRKSRRNPSKAKLRRHAKKMPRDSRGRFLPKGRSPSRSRRRSNPPIGGRIGERVMDAGVASVQIVAGKAASRAIPPMIGLDQTGPMGVAVRTLVGVGVALVVEQVMPRGELAERLLEGAFVGAIEDLAVGYGLPVVGPALARPAGMGAGGGSTGLYTGSSTRVARRDPGRFGAYTGSGPTLPDVHAGLTAAHRN